MTNVKHSKPGHWGDVPADEPFEQPNSRAAGIACLGVVAFLFLLALVVVIVRASLKG